MVTYKKNNYGLSRAVRNPDEVTNLPFKDSGALIYFQMTNLKTTKRMNFNP